MAQWSSRDSRWIVEDLGKNGSNVGSWHWEEKSKMQWSRQRLHELTDGIEAELDPDVGAARLTGLEDLTGEAYLTRRKGNKILVIYDLNITLNWTGKLATEDKEVSGSMKIAEFTLGNDEVDYDILTTADNQDSKYHCLLNAVQRLRPRMLSILAKFDEELRSLQQ